MLNINAIATEVTIVVRQTVLSYIHQLEGRKLMQILTIQSDVRQKYLHIKACQ